MVTTTLTMRLKSEVVESIKKSQRLRNRLQYELNKSSITIDRWLKLNSENLTTAHALKIISEETGLSQDKLLNN